jgi:RHS repeat-associated protein
MVMKPFIHEIGKRGKAGRRETEEKRTADQALLKRVFKEHPAKTGLVIVPHIRRSVNDRISYTQTGAETTVFVYNASGQLVAEYSTQTAQSPQTSYLTTDHLGSTRLVTDQLGAVKDRKDYGAFGDETATAARVSALGYTTDEPTRIRHTGYEKDAESSLEFAQARYYSTTHGRYTSADPLTASASIRNPQTFNRYTYVLNSPNMHTVEPRSFAGRKFHHMRRCGFDGFI